MKVTYFPAGMLQANCVILSDDAGHHAVVDPGDNAPLVLDKLAALGGTVEAVLLTHAHFDHMLSVREVLAATNAKLMVFTDEEAALSDTSLSLIPSCRQPYSLSADRLLNDGDTVEIGTLKVSVLHTPGHTKGSCCYLCEEVLVSGDTLFAGGIGRTDLPGGNTAAILHSLQRLSTLPPSIRVIPGHGEETTIGTERRTNPFMMRNSL